MNPKILVGVIGAFTVLLGVLGLFYPTQAMQIVGFGYTNPQNLPGTHGEVRAVYGGMVLVAGIFTLLSAPDPRANQGRLLLIGLLWIGACSGRMLGVFIDGNPGVIGWLSAVVEIVGGGALIFASQTAPANEPPVVSGI